MLIHSRARVVYGLTGVGFGCCFTYTRNYAACEWWVDVIIHVNVSQHVPYTYTYTCVLPPCIFPSSLLYPI